MDTAYGGVGGLADAGREIGCAPQFFAKGVQLGRQYAQLTSYGAEGGEKKEKARKGGVPCSRAVGEKKMPPSTLGSGQKGFAVRIALSQASSRRWNQGD